MELKEADELAKVLNVPYAIESRISGGFKLTIIPDSNKIIMITMTPESVCLISMFIDRIMVFCDITDDFKQVMNGIKKYIDDHEDK